MAFVQELETQVELYKSKEARKLVAEVKNNPILLRIQLFKILPTEFFQGFQSVFETH